jgi:hypothetical protein
MASLDAPGLLGAWRFAGDDRPHSYFFGVGGELIQSEGGRVVAMLTWRVDGDVLLVDQPSAPRLDRLPFQLASAATLRIGDDWYVREAPAAGVARVALMAGAAWYAAENVHPSGEPFIPFLFIERGQQRVLERIVAGSAQEADEAAFERVKQEPAARLVWARDGRVRTPEPHDAVMLDCFEPGSAPTRWAALYAWRNDAAQVTSFMPLPVDAMAFR